MPSPLFLGQGLLRPFQRDRKRDFANDNGLPLIRACVGQVLGTLCGIEGTSAQGELPWRPEFGSLLFRLKHRKGVELDELARVYVVNALARWEPRVVPTEVQLEYDRLALVLTIHLVYDVIDQNVPGNNVLIAGVEQSVAIPVAA